MAIVMAFPVKTFLLLLQKLKVIIGLLLSFYILIGVIGSCISSKLFRRLQRDKSIGLANLIKQMEATEQAERKSMNKSIAFASASHDIRASLACITGLIKLCCVDVLPDSDVYRNLIQMDSCTAKLLGILNSVLEISKVEAGRMELENVEFSMAQTIEESVDFFHVVALEKGLEVIWDPCDFSVLMSSNVRGDCRRFKQILDNLLNNAIKYTAEGHVVVRSWAKKVGSKEPEFTSIQQGNFPNIWVHLSRCFCYVGGAYPNKKPHNSIYHGQGDMEFTFEIDDTGIGIPKEKRDSIFKNYFQVKESNLGCEGTGLGLGIAKSYVALMGGNISIKEKLPTERGSCFMFNIFLESNDVSSNNDEEGLDSCNIPILNRLHSFSTKTKAKVQSNIHALAISQGITVEGIQCLLAIRRSETSRILKDWMKLLGIMVSVAQQPVHMYAVLKRMTHNYSASGSCDSSIGSSGVNSEYSSPRDENGQVLTFSMKDDPKKASLKGSNKYLLVIIDLDLGDFSEMHNFLTCLAKGNHHFHQYKVICLTDSTASCSKLPCDLVLHKPIHGSRFYKILGLMQEFRQTNEDLKLEIVRESTELETKKLLSSAYLQQSNCKVLKDGIDTKPLSDMKILLVEDTLLLRQIAEKVLSRAGGIVTSVDNGLKALEVVTSRISEGNSRRLPFDLILMDCQMPGMDGYEATRNIRSVEGYDIHIPIIALSAHAAPEEAKKSLLCGMDYHLTKPIEINKLLEAIKLISQTLN
ncbi:Histidine kinase CKI1 [Platanthera guangdongensis]|uniref:histidine kinase n=1 Tax=Platanthera guangdongensis TaxID=2320717 RepID=A0ABR2LUR8_9ASPA